MPTTTKNKKTTTKTTKTAKEAVANSISQADIEAQYAKLLEMQNELQAKLNQLNSMPVASVAPVTTATTDSYEYKEINPNKKTKVYSLTFGFLSLHCPHCGFTEFKDYGSFKILNYAQLSDYMLTCSETFKSGALYIVDPEIVESLGLDSYYENLFSVELVDKIFKGEKVDYNKIAVSTVNQKNSLAKYIALKVYDEEFKDFNVIAELSKVCGRDIMADVNQMKEISQNMEANN